MKHNLLELNMIYGKSDGLKLRLQPNIAKAISSSCSCDVDLRN
jgi:hypothetical protein